MGKAKAKFLTRSILKKINSTKRILKKKHLEKYCSKTKTMWGKYCSNLQCFFYKKITKLNSQPAQYEKKTKTEKNHFGKKIHKNKGKKSYRKTL